MRELEENRLVPYLENTGPNNTIQIDKDDIRPDVLRRMVAYGVNVTNETINQFPVSNTQGKFSLQDDLGNPAGITDPGENGQATFTATVHEVGFDGKSAEESFRSTSSSGFLDVDSSSGGKFKIKKGKSSSTDQNATDIFKEVNDLGENSPFVKRVRAAQVQNNRFTLGKTLIPRSGLNLEQGSTVESPGSYGDGSVREDDSNLGIGYAQQEFGKYGPRKFPSPQGDTAVLVKLRDLKKIGVLTMLQASGEYFIPNNPDDVAQEVAARGAALAPGLARIGQKIDVNRINPVKIMKDVNPDFTKPSLEDNIIRDPVMSYGSVNNWLAPFAGLTSTASIASAALLALTVGGLIKGAAAIINARRPATEPNLGGNPSISDRRKRLGSFLGKVLETDTFRNTEFEINVARTSHDYFLCVSKGVDIFFGVSSATSATSKIAKNHGYYNTIMRTIVRSTTDFLLAATGGMVNTSDAGRERNVNDVKLLGNPAGPLELVQKLNDSLLLKFCNILATIGDIAMNHADAGFTLDENGEVIEFISDIDKIIVDGEIGPRGEASLNPAALQSVSRLPGAYRNALAWGSQTAKSMYLIPNSIFRAEATFLGASDQSRNPTEALASSLAKNNLNVVKGPNGLNGNRILEEDVKALEEYLEASYMPFYFHDIRTNEILSFHAFMESMSDSFEPEYTDVDGYGRIGKAMIYKNTQRRISLEFRVVATSEDDFDSMWYKVNRLIMMVYPQYTQGRQVGTGNNKFIQPFSQLPGASPLVRLRLGDVWKSNYSRFGAARLFGLGSNQFSLEGQNSTLVYNVALLRNREQVTDRMSRRGEFQVGEHAILTPLPTQRSRGAGNRNLGYPRLGNLSDSPGQPSQAQRTGAGGRAGAGVNAFVSVTNSNSAGGRTVTPRASPAGAPLVIAQELKVRITGVTNSQTDPTLKLYTFSVPNGGAGRDGIFGCSQHDLRADPAEITRVAANQSSQENLPDTNTNTQKVVSNFFNPAGENGNSVIKAFESTKGKGLAGFIKNLRIDWGDARWETGRHNARAPMMVKVSMDFEPIHDINPGLDSDGFMTAPVYNVGDTMKTWTNGMPEDRNQTDREESLMRRAQQLTFPRSGNGVAVGNGANGGGVGNNR